MKNQKMEGKIEDFMEDDHRRLDGLFQSFRKIKNDEPEKAKQFFKEFKMGLQRHIVWEEQILFPIFDSKNGLAVSDPGPTAVMREEHKRIKKFLEDMHDKVRVLTFDTDELENGLLDVLGEHNHKEENILYPWIDETLNDEERKETFRKMEELPEEAYKKCCCK